jgi:hypothetical protein
MGGRPYLETPIIKAKGMQFRRSPRQCSPQPQVDRGWTMNPIFLSSFRYPGPEQPIDNMGGKLRDNDLRQRAHIWTVRTAPSHPP